MRALVTGGCGYVGSHAVRELTASGHEVLLYDNLSSGHRKFSEGYKFIEADIANETRMAEALKGIDAVMHFAASAYFGESVANPREYFRNNVEAAIKLLDAVLATSARLFIFSSTCATYGIPQTLPLTESHPQAPINPYGATKLFFEHVLAAYSVSHGLRSVSLRYFNAAGAHADGSIGELHDPETHLIPLALKAALGAAPLLKIFGNHFNTPDGTCIRDYIHVSDLGRAHVLALDYLAKGGETTCLNLGTGEGTSVAAAGSRSGRSHWAKSASLLHRPEAQRPSRLVRRSQARRKGVGLAADTRPPRNSRFRLEMGAKARGFGSSVVKLG